MSAKIGAAMSGGGPKGAFAAGFLYQLFDVLERVRFDVVAGTSTGSLIAPLLAQQIVRGPFDKNKGNHELAIVSALYLESTFDTFFERGPMDDETLERMLNIEGVLAIDALVTGSMVQAENLRVLIDKYLPDDPEFWGQPEVPILVQSTVGLKRKDIYYFRTDRPSHRPLMKLATRASAQQPVIMPLVEIETNDYDLPPDGTPRFSGKDWYCDGGAADYVPIRGAIAAGANKVLAIVHRKLTRCTEHSRLDDAKCFPPDEDGKLPLEEKPGAVETLSRTISSLTYQVGVDDLRLAMLADQLSTIQENHQRLIERIETADLPRQTRQTLLRGIKKQLGFRTRTSAEDVPEQLAVKMFLDANVELWPVFIPDNEPLPKNDLDFSKNATLFRAGAMECNRHLENGLEQWLLGT